VSTNEELLERKSSSSGLENRDCGRSGSTALTLADSGQRVCIYKVVKFKFVLSVLSKGRVIKRRIINRKKEVSIGESTPGKRLVFQSKILTKMCKNHFRYITFVVLPNGVS
jgi:hypothetical protein